MKAIYRTELTICTLKLDRYTLKIAWDQYNCYSDGLNMGLFRPQVQQEKFFDLNAEAARLHSPKMRLWLQAEIPST